jgi:excisionase family DNA binding protein
MTATLGRWLTVREAAERASVSRDTIYAACDQKALRHSRVSGRRSIRFRVEWVDAWLDQHTVVSNSSRLEDHDEA